MVQIVLWDKDSAPTRISLPLKNPVGALSIFFQIISLVEIFNYFRSQLSKSNQEMADHLLLYLFINVHHYNLACISNYFEKVIYYNVFCYFSKIQKKFSPKTSFGDFDWRFDINVFKTSFKQILKNSLHYITLYI